MLVMVCQLTHQRGWVNFRRNYKFAELRDNTVKVNIKIVVLDPRLFEKVGDLLPP